MWVTPVCALFSWGWVIPHLRDWELMQQQGFGFVQGEKKGIARVSLL